MNAMQYKITLPNDYDMSLIRTRVEENGTKTDNFKGLLFKAYLISENADGAISNTYSPLYVWEDSYRMSQFIFEGFYDTIIHDFGWQSIQIGIPLRISLPEHFKEACYLLEKTVMIHQNPSLLSVPKELSKLLSSLPQSDLGELIVYNPDKWQATVFKFYAKKPIKGDAALYEILHISSK